ncbi:hypothetical protein HPB50_004120 [Hyalomma asiaticum]|uniref:Uncharacterized protein n=1 Tax=Hyalomma asiaticum TaxID=266040 RepID=A0ACB7SDU3_HYAAI|nr:hypothetical protein HPB50_004120 [Hyalomma asiaticum]
MDSPERTETRDWRGNLVFPDTKPGTTADPKRRSAAGSTAGMDCEAPTCRICYRRRAKGQGPLIAPCSCQGLIGFVHKGCLEMRLREKGTDRCDVCQQRISVHQKPAPVWNFFRDPNHRTDILRMVLNAVSCVGDVIVLSFAWTYASGFLGSVGWLTYLFFLSVLLFQTIFWMMVEVIRIVACYEPVRKWRDEACSLDVMLTGVDRASHPQSTDAPEVIVLREMNTAVHGDTANTGTCTPKDYRKREHGQVAATLDRSADSWGLATATEGRMSPENAIETNTQEMSKRFL